MNLLFYWFSVLSSDSYSFFLGPSHNFTLKFYHFLKFFCGYLYAWISVYHVQAMPLETGRGHWILWNRQLWVTMWCWETFLCTLEKQAVLFWAISADYHIAFNLLFFLFLQKKQKSLFCIFLSDIDFSKEHFILTLFELKYIDAFFISFSIWGYL